MRTAEPSRWLACWLLAAVVLVQSLWLPFHLASERHLAAGEAPTLGFSVAAAAPRGEEMRGDGGESPLGRLHFGLEHKSARDTRVDDEVALSLDGDSACPPDPLAALFDTTVAKLALQPAASCVRCVRISPQPARAPPAA
jgi:hypothetical protein